MPQTRLGKGLDALIPQTASSQVQSISYVDLKQIDPNPQQPRKHFDEQALQDLATSIKKHGIIQPIVVNSHKNRYQLIAGERRLQAAQKAGLKQVPVIIRDSAPEQNLELALIENIQRENLNPIEEAQAYLELKQDYKLSMKQIASRVGKNIATISNKTRLLDLPQSVQQGLIQDKISEGHGRALLGLKQKELIEIAYAQILKLKLNVRQVEMLVQQKTSTPRKVTKSTKTNKWKTLAAEMQSALGTKVQIKEAKGKGQIQIEFYALEELQELAAKIKTIN